MIPQTPHYSNSLSTASLARNMNKLDTNASMLRQVARSEQRYAAYRTVQNNPALEQLRRFLLRVYARIDRSRIQLIKDQVRRWKARIVGSVGLAGLVIGAMLEFSHHEALAVTMVVAGGLVVQRGMGRRKGLERQLREAQELAASRDQRGCHYPPTRWERLGVSAEFRALVDRAAAESEEVCLGRIDASGRVLSEFGEIPHFPSVGAAEFVERDKFDIDIVLYEGHVFIKKNFRNEVQEFVAEWLALERLYGRARVPAVRKVLIDKSILYVDLVCGRTLLEVLRDHGALMRDSDVEHDPRFKNLEGERKQRALDALAAHLVHEVLGEKLLCNIEHLIANIHAARVSDLDIRFANIILGEDGMPWVIDLHDARCYPRSSILLAIKQDGDRVLFNRVFQRNLPTLCRR